MLKGIPSIVSPELLKLLSEMGHGDEISICDANCPAYGLVDKVVRCEVKSAPGLVDAILKLMPLDTYQKPVYLMELVAGDDADTTNWTEYEAVVAKHTDEKIEHVERFAFYDKMKNSYAAVLTSDIRPYGNIILKKGVVTEN